MLEFIFLLFGFFLLIKGADLLIDGSVSLAQKFKIPDVIIGATIIAFGTSAPELVVNLISAFSGKTDIALGNIIGSNIANILLVLGISSIIKPLKINKRTLNQDVPISVLSVFILILLIFLNKLFFNEFMLSQITGLILLFGFFLFLFYLYKESANHEFEEQTKLNSDLISAILVLIGIFGLFLGGKLVVENAILIARSFGLSEFFISLTIVAIGTSLPELITSVLAMLKGKKGIAIGNVLGSNAQNILLILSSTSIISPIFVSISKIPHLFFLLLITSLIYLIAKLTNNELNRKTGILFVILYFLYLLISLFQ